MIGLAGGRLPNSQDAILIAINYVIARFFHLRFSQQSSRGHRRTGTEIVESRSCRTYILRCSPSLLPAVALCQCRAACVLRLSPSLLPFSAVLSLLLCTCFPRLPGPLSSPLSARSLSLPLIASAAGPGVGPAPSNPSLAAPPACLLPRCPYVPASLLPRCPSCLSACAEERVRADDDGGRRAGRQVAERREQDRKAGRRKKAETEKQGERQGEGAQQEAATEKRVDKGGRRQRQTRGYMRRRG